MIKFDSYEDLANTLNNYSYNFESTAVVLTFEDTIELLKLFLTEYDPEIQFIDINTIDYDGEYYTTVTREEEQLNFSVAKAYDTDGHYYYGQEGIIFVHGDVDSKYVLDMENHYLREHMVILDFDFSWDLDEEMHLEKPVNDEQHGFTQSWSDNNGNYYSRSFYSTDHIMVKEMMKHWKN